MRKLRENAVWDQKSEIIKVVNIEAGMHLKKIIVI